MSAGGRFSLTSALVAINVLVYAWVALTGGFDSTQSLVDHGALLGVLVERGQYWRIVSAAFLHAGILHIGLNMLALYQVGSFLESLTGSVRYAVIYVFAMIGAGIAVVLFSYSDVTVGASGAIFGLFGALVAIGIRLGQRGRSLVMQTLPVIGLNLAFGFAVPHISNAGHIGGLISGFVAGFAVSLMLPQRLAALRDPTIDNEVA